MSIPRLSERRLFNGRVRLSFRSDDAVEAYVMAWHAPYVGKRRRSAHLGRDADGGAVDHFAQREGRIDLGDMRHGGKPLLVDALVVLEVAGGDPEDIVVLARHQVAGEHVRA